ncbi:unnamed protein product [marine sediment metagenome]|uniref:Ryanodine receptor Ryr domain-containing protein n=1 Tax=marine sediment metagenome TaxID=412755 RepID=X1FAW6_9ZZZZ
MNEDELIEKLANLEHEQWIKWSKTISEQERISEERRVRWQKYFVPYSELTEEVKEYDRVWARKIVKLLKSEGVL